MKTLKSLLFMACMFLASLPIYAASPTKILFNWSDSFSSVPACTATITTNCVSSFILTEPVQGFSKTIDATGGTSSTVFSYLQTPLPPAGTYTYSIVAVEVYPGGTTTSGPATAVVVVPKSPDIPVPFTGVLQ